MKRNLLTLILALALLLSACELLPDTGEKPREVSEQSIWAMDTQMDLRLYGDEDGAVMTDLTLLLNELSLDLSANADSGALSELNSTGRSENPRLAALAEAGLRISARTGGALDLTLLPVSRRWGFVDQAYLKQTPALPAAEELEALRPGLGMEKLSVADGVVTLSDGAVLDLGSLGKGYAADLCRERMEEAKLSGILSLGGNIQTVGKKPDGTDWTVAILDPDDPGSYLLTMTVTGTKSVVTSGDYQRFFERDGTRYCHILNPETLSPARNGLRMVTIVADEGFLADGLSTALFVMGLERGIEFWRAGNDFEAIWLTEDGTVTVTEGLEDRISYKNAEVVRR